MKINWQTKKLDEICNVDYGIRIVKTRNIPGDFDVYGGGGKTFTSNEYNREDCFIVSRFAMSANCVRKVEGKFFLNDSGLSVSTKDENLLSQDFLDRFLLASQDVIYSLGRGQAQRNLHIEGFKNLEIPLPPLATQQKIVARLDELLGNIAQAKRLRQEAIADTEKILSQTLREIFEEGKEKGWEEKGLGDVCDVQSGGTPSKSVPDYWNSNDVAWLRSESCNNEKVTYADYYISQKGFENSSVKLLRPKTTLIALVGATIGKTGFLTFESTTNQNIAGLYPKDTRILLPEYLFIVAQSLYPIFISLGSGKFKMANLSFVKSLRILIPSLPEQHQIVTRFDALSAKLRELRQLQVEQLEDLKKLEKAYLREVFNEELI